MTEASFYIKSLRGQFTAYRNLRFSGQGQLFEDRPVGGPTVFRREHADQNLLIAPDVDNYERDQIIAAVPLTQRHRHFGSMQSSQALAQSVFGTIIAKGLLPRLSDIEADDGNPAFGAELLTSKVELEKAVDCLGEPRPTSLDVWISGKYRVAIECKLSESEFGTCSRPRLTPTDPVFNHQHCDGTYSHQRKRSSPCALSEIGVRYWDYMEALFGLSPTLEHRPCPLARTYQLARNLMAALVDGGTLRPNDGHVLVVYDARNPAFNPGGEGLQQWDLALSALKIPGVLRRLSWQRFLEQFPSGLEWLRSELNEKYGFGKAMTRWA